MKNIKRLQDIMTMKLNGATYAEIARAFSLSAARIHQLISPPPEIRQAIKLRAQNKCERCGILTQTGDIHHKGADLIDHYNDPSQLEYLCPTCHRAIHTGAITDKLVRHTCTKCGHEWSTMTERPSQCANPSCNNTYWDAPPSKKATQRETHVYVNPGQYAEIIKLGAEPGEFARQAIERELRRRLEEAERIDKACAKMEGKK